MANYGDIIRPTKTLRGMELDVRVSPNVGTELYDQIVRSVEHTQKFVVTELPDILIVTEKQFASLNNYTEEMYNTTDRIMVTPYNVMEVTVDREFDTVDSIEEVIESMDQIEIKEAPHE
jgi:hypothetical protein